MVEDFRAPGIVEDAAEKGPGRAGRRGQFERDGSAVDDDGQTEALRRRARSSCRRLSARCGRALGPSPGAHRSPDSHRAPARFAFGRREGPCCVRGYGDRVGEAAEATVIELFVSGDGSLLVVPIVDIAVGDAAVLSYNAVQQLGAEAWQLAHQRIRAGRDATIRTFTASLGGQCARFRTESVLAGKGGSAALAAYLGGGTQMHDFRTLQEHAAPRTKSDLVFKGAVGGTARSVYSGLIRMRHGAKGADAFQTNRNLVLSDGRMPTRSPIST